MREAARRKAHLIAFPEMCTTPYFCGERNVAIDRFAEPVPGGPAVARMSRLAADNGIVVVLPLAERAGPHAYNSAAVIDADGRLVGRYRKNHLPQSPGCWERDYFQAGHGWPAFPTAAGRIGVLICYDRWFPEGWRALALADAQIIINPVTSTIPRTDPRATMIQPAAAFSNHVYVATANRPGPDYSGGSYIAGPDGHVRGARASARQGLVVRDLDLGMVESTRRTWPFLRDRRPDTYQRLMR